MNLRLVHVSGIGADPRSHSLYIRKRGEGELAVREAFADAILVRPAVMFGPDDAFLTTILKLIKRLPIYPMFGSGNRFRSRVTGRARFEGRFGAFPGENGRALLREKSWVWSQNYLVTHMEPYRRVRSTRKAGYVFFDRTPIGGLGISHDEYS